MNIKIKLNEFLNYNEEEDDEFENDNNNEQIEYIKNNLDKISPKILSKIYQLIKDDEDSNRESLAEILIRVWMPLFDEYPELRALPVYAWGRYYKYELAGEEFEKYVDEYGFSRFRYMFYHNQILNWDLLKKIDDKYNKQGSKIWTGEIGDYLPVRDDVVKEYKFDGRGGKCLVIEKDVNYNFTVKAYDCDSPE